MHTCFSFLAGKSIILVVKGNIREIQMQALLETITPVEWGLLGITVVALVLAFMAWRRAGRALQLIKNQSIVEIVSDKESEQQVEQRPAVSLDVTANKNEYDQVTIEISNLGQLAATQVKLDIDAPENIYDAENLGSGIESANVTASSAIRPRLAVLDAENQFPISEIGSGKTLEIPAALTMAHGKICDFPVTLAWKDENGVSHRNKIVLTV